LVIFPAAGGASVAWISGRMPLPKTEARMEMERNALKVFSDLDELSE